jgi:hypothetical protein
MASFIQIVEPFTAKTQLFDFNSTFTQGACFYFIVRESFIAKVLSHLLPPQLIDFESSILADAKSSISTFLLIASC